MNGEWQKMTTRFRKHVSRNHTDQGREDALCWAALSHPAWRSSPGLHASRDPADAKDAEEASAERPGDTEGTGFGVCVEGSGHLSHARSNKQARGDRRNRGGAWRGGDARRIRELACLSMSRHGIKRNEGEKRCQS